MSLFWSHLCQYAFLQYALIAGILASGVCGVMGSFVVVRRSTYVAGAIAHCVLGGMGAARWLEKVHGVEWMSPMLGATVAALIAAGLISWVTLTQNQREDTVLSTIWALGMALGISFIAATPGYYEDLMSYLFGNILMVSRQELWIMAALNGGVLLATLLFYDKFLFISFDINLARLRGLPVSFFHTLLICLTALSVVLLTQIVGLILVIALLTLPAAIAGQWTRRLGAMMGLAVGLCLVFIASGLALSYEPELPPGATIIEIAGGAYLVSLTLKTLGRKWRGRKKAVQAD